MRVIEDLVAVYYVVSIRYLQALANVIQPFLLLVAHSMYHFDATLDTKYDEVVIRASEQGFKFIAPPAGISSRKWWPYFYYYLRGTASFNPDLGPSGTIIFERSQFRFLQQVRYEGYTEIVLAHELGHAIRHQYFEANKRSKHPFFLKTKTLTKGEADEELFAWAFAAYLYGVPVVLPLVQKDPRVKPAEFERICAG